MAQFTNQATLSYAGNVVSSNIAVGEIVETLSATKTAFPETYRQGDNITYVVNLVNSGTTPITNLTLTDDLGGYEFDGATVYPLTYVDGSVKVFENGAAAVIAPTVTPGPPLVIEGIEVPAGGATSVVYTAEANGYAPLGTGGSIVNTASATGNGTAEASATVTPAEEAELAIMKSITPSAVRNNSNVVYTFTIQNFGTSEAGADVQVKVTDTFDPVLSSLTASLDGTPMTSVTDYTYSETTGLFETTEGFITVPAATPTQDPTTGIWTVTPGETTLTVSGTIS